MTAYEGRQTGQESNVDIHLNREGVLNLACAALLASAIGFSAIDARADDCSILGPHIGDSVAGDNNRLFCDAAESSDPLPGRPGMRFLKNLA